MATTEEIVAKYRLDLDDLKKQVNELQGELGKVDKKAGETSGNVDKAFGKLNDKLKDLGKAVVAAFAVERIVAFGKASVQAFAESEAGALKLRAAVSAQGGLQKDFDNLNKQAEELAAITIFDDDSIKAAQTQALQFGLNAQAVQKLIPIVADFAAATGQDLNAALQATTAGINGQVDGLKRFGIQLDTTATRNERFAAVVDQLTGKFNGQAQALTQTLGGAIGQSEKAFGELQEAVGQALAPAITKTAQAATELIQAFTPSGPSVAEQFQEQAQQLGVLRIALTSANTSTKDRVKIINELKATYPGYLTNINAEKVNNEQLLPILKKINDELINKIVLAKEDERVTAENEKVAARRARRVELELKAQELLLEAEQKGVDLGGDNLTLQQKINRVLNDRDLRRQATGGILIDAETRLLSNLADVSTGLALATSEETQATQKLTAAQQKRAEVVKLLGIEEQKANENAVPATTGLEKLTDAEKKAAEDRQKAREEAALKARQAAEKLAADELKIRQDLAKAELEQDQKNLATYDADRRRAIEARYNQEEEAAVAAAQAAQERLLADLQQGLITWEQYEQRKADITAQVASRDPERRRALLEQDIATLKQQIQNRLDYGQDVTELETQLKDKQAQLQAQTTADEQAAAQQRIKNAEDEAKKKLEADQKLAEERKKLQDLAYQDAVNLVGQLFELNNTQLEQELAALQEQQTAQQEKADADQAALDQQLAAKIISQQQYEQQRQALDQQRAKSEQLLAAETARIKRKQDANAKLQAIFRLGIDTAAAIVAQLREVPLPAGAPLLALLGGIAAAQLAAILAAKPPQYAEGIDWVPLGKNRRGRDTIPAMLDEGERVVPRRQNLKHWELYQAIDEDRLPQYIFNKYTAPALEKERASGGALARALTQTLSVQQALGTSAGDPTELRRLWRRGLAINNLDELAELLQRSQPSPYRN